MQFETHELLKVPRSTGVLLTSLPNDIFTEITTQVNFIVKNKKLAGKLSSNVYPIGGQISDQISFSVKKNLLHYLGNLVNHYENFYDISSANNIVQHFAWLNLQKKYEYNPNHNHNGDLSYVIYVKVPYNLQDEDNMPNTINSNVSANGRFCFNYVNEENKVAFKVIDITKDFEGKIMMFPSHLVHCVYPFYTSDEYRITIAGNIWYK